MEYKGYNAKIEYDDDEKIFHGRVIDINDIVNFEGDCVEDLEQEFKDSVDAYISFCLERGEQPEKPFSGIFSIRMSPELHEGLSKRAAAKGISMNKLVNELLEKEFA